MNYLQRRRLDELAARYVTGTMGRLARRRFTAIASAHPAARLAVEAWQDRLQPLVEGVDPVRPPRRVWRQVKRQIKADPAPARSRLWQWATGAMAAIALAFGLLWYQQPAPEATFAALLDEQGQIAWSISIDDADRLQISAALPPTLSAQQRHELWVLSGIDGVPVSLGLLPRAGEAARDLTPAQLLALADATTLAVSIEPLTGSPTGQPTGPVILTAPLVQRT